MESIASLFIHMPLHILIVAAVFAAGYLARRFSALGEARHPSALLVPAIAWALYAAWE